jgi:hypothetical protein
VTTAYTPGVLVVTKEEANLTVSSAAASTMIDVSSPVGGVVSTTGTVRRVSNGAGVERVCRSLVLLLASALLLPAL